MLFNVKIPKVLNLSAMTCFWGLQRPLHSLLTYVPVFVSVPPGRWPCYGLCRAVMFSHCHLWRWQEICFTVQFVLRNSVTILLVKETFTDFYITSPIYEWRWRIVHAWLFSSPFTVVGYLATQLEITSPSLLCSEGHDSIIARQI